MEILGIKISESTAELIENLYASLSKPVRYLPLDGEDILGAIEVSETPAGGVYSVSLLTAIDGRLFESNVLYELYHIRQFEQGFPTLCSKNSELLRTQNEFVEELRGTILSTVLDLEVFVQLMENRFVDTLMWFTDNIYKDLTLSGALYLNRLNDKHNFANHVVNFVRVLYHTGENQDEEVREIYAGYPTVLERSFELRDTLRMNPPNSPKTAAIALGLMVDSLELWDLFFIKLGDETIRTKGEFAAFKPGI